MMHNLFQQLIPFIKRWHMVQEITAEDQVIDMLRGASMCDLDEVMRRCPTLTWNQIFLAVDHLSRTRQIRLMRAKGGRYTVTCLRPQESQANGEAYPINDSISEPDYQDEDVHLGARIVHQEGVPTSEARSSPLIVSH